MTALNNDIITEQLKQMSEIFKNIQTEREAFLLMPTHEGFALYKISEEIGKNILSMQRLKEIEESLQENIVHPNILPTNQSIGMQNYLNMIIKMKDVIDKHKDGLLNVNNINLTLP